MAYTINKFSGEPLIVLDDGTIDTSTSLGLVGRNYVGYGETQNENFVFLLENFANDAPPSRPLKGQMWFNTNDNLAYVYDGASWAVIGSAVLSDDPPEVPNPGALWLRTPVNTLNIWTGAAWAFIGPEAVPGFGVTRCRSTSLEDSEGNDRPVILLEINNIVIAVCTSVAFTINPSSSISGISNTLIAGINLSSTVKINGNITGNAGSADRLSSVRLINNVAFDGQQNITVKASTTNRLIKGSYLTGSNFDGSEEVTLDVDATSANVIGKVVARNSSGGFAAGTITADLVGNVSGDVSSTGTSSFNIITANQFVGATLTGNAFSASQLATARKINGVNFDGTNDITVTAAAGTLTGNTLNSTVLLSSLTSVGTLSSLTVADVGVGVGTGDQLRFLLDSGIPTVRSNTGQLNFDIGSAGPDISFVNAATSVALGGPSAPAIIGDNTTNLGITGYKFNNIYANNFLGNATTATLATTATNLAGGGLGSLPYQTANGATGFLNIGSPGYVLRVGSGNTIEWEPLNFEQLNKGSYLNFVNTNTSSTVSFFNSTDPVTISVDATSTNTASKVVARDGSGNFAAGTISANLTGNVTGNVTGNAGTATRLQTPRTINGVAFDGTANITIEANDPNSGAPVGSILYYPSSSIPVGWMMCDGSAISTSIFSLLFSKIGYNYGGSGGVFRLPDLRGEFIRSWDGGRGVDSGRTLGSSQGDLFRSHQHKSAWSQDAGAAVTNSVLYAGRVDQNGGSAAGFRDVEAGSAGASEADEAVMFTTATGGSETRPRNVALVACIKVFGEVDEADQVTAASVIAYVNSIPNYVITSGNTVYSTSGFTNQVGSWNNGANYFDVFPPAPKTMSNLAAFIPSIAVIHYAGGVNGDDSMRCTWSNLGDRIRVYVQNTEQRSTPAANFMAIWS